MVLLHPFANLKPMSGVASGRPARRVLVAAPVAAVLAASLLSGCATDNHVTVGAVPDDYRTTHPIVLSEREQTADIPVGHGDRHLSLTQRSTVEAVIDNYKNNGSGIIHILVPAGAPNEAAAMRLRDDIVGVLRKAGIAPHYIASETYTVPTPDAAAPIRLSYSAITASTDQCGKWPEDLANNVENRHYKNFGCATQNNLAAQLANPSDLLGPRARGDIDAEQRGGVIKTYEDPVTYPAGSNDKWVPETSY